MYPSRCSKSRQFAVQVRRSVSAKAEAKADAGASNRQVWWVKVLNGELFVDKAVESRRIPNFLGRFQYIIKLQSLQLAIRLTGTLEMIQHLALMDLFQGTMALTPLGSLLTRRVRGGTSRQSLSTPGSVKLKISKHMVSMKCHLGMHEVNCLDERLWAAFLPCFCDLCTAVKYASIKSSAPAGYA